MSGPPMGSNGAAVVVCREDRLGSADVAADVHPSEVFGEHGGQFAGFPQAVGGQVFGAVRSDDCAVVHGSG